ncbi:MAG: NAD(P)/FAD-dependent oxidoreductase [Acidobacteria bacterium]|nr:NAD(P)/FAD-dependent oxidoreductase [Acidobacteriota bacterium]
MNWDAIVIGGGINGLVCAAYLAKAGRKTLVLEARASVGGGACTNTIAPGFRIPRLAHATGPLRRDVVDHLQLASRGLSFVSGPTELAALDPDGGAVVITHDPATTADGLRRRSAHDAAAWPRFVATRAALGKVIGSLFTISPPSVDEPTARDGWHVLRTLRAFRALGRDDAYRLLRWGPMPVADLVSECFDGELLRATLAGDGIFGTMFGPWSAGSGMASLLVAANEAVAAPNSRFVEGGPGRLADLLGTIVREAGSEVRTQARVIKVVVRGDRARGVALENGDEVNASLVVSGLDPKRTLLQLCDPVDLAPEFLWRMRHYRAKGAVAKVNLALSALPAFRKVDRDTLTGRVRIGPDLDYIERAFDHAKYGRFSPEPWIELTIPSLLDPSLAPPGAHVLSAYVQFAPYALRPSNGSATVDWDIERQALGQAALRTLEEHAPGLRALVVALEVLTPLDLEREWGFTGGHIFHGELALDQLLTMRPLLGWGDYRTPIDGLYLCGSGTHPGTGLTGGSGANAAREILRSWKPAAASRGA